MFRAYINTGMEGACSKGRGQILDRNLGSMAEEEGPLTVPVRF